MADLTVSELVQRDLLPLRLAKLPGLGRRFIPGPIPVTVDGAVLSGNRVRRRASLDNVRRTARA
jgi:hypothetical protein